MSRKSKDKGTDFERKVASILGGWWLGRPFRRVPCSGAWDKQVEGQQLASGDIYGEHEFPFSVECKKQEGWKLESILVGKCKAFDDWWGQCTEDATRSCLLPMLVFSRNYAPDLVCVRADDWFHCAAGKCDEVKILIPHRVIFLLCDIDRFGKASCITQRDCVYTGVQDND